MNIKIITQPEISIIVNNYTNAIITDNPIDKIITAKFNLIAENKQEYDYPQLTLWQNEEYDTIGNWTNEDVNKRIEELLTKKSNG